MGASAFAWLAHYVPILRWARSYSVRGRRPAPHLTPRLATATHSDLARCAQIREHFLHDLVAGCTVGVMAVPQGMSYAQVAGLGPRFGLYSSFFPMLLCKLHPARVGAAGDRLGCRPVTVCTSQMACLAPPCTSCPAPRPSCRSWYDTLCVTDGVGVRAWLWLLLWRRVGCGPTTDAERRAA